MSPARDKELRPKVGMGIVVLREGKILLGKRMNTHGAGGYSLPGGHVEYGESFEDTLRREMREETGLAVTNIRLNAVLNHIIEGKHYVDVDFVCEAPTGEAKRLEPEKCEGWDWYDPAHLPGPLFPPSRRAIEHWQKGVIMEHPADIKKF